MKALPKPYRTSLTAIAAALVCGIALLATLNLWYLRRLQSENVHLDAAQTVLNLGMNMTRHLAHANAAAPNAWENLRQLLLSLKTVEPALLYATITEDDVTLFHEDLSLPSNHQTATAPNNISVGRRILATGNDYIPALTFSTPIPNAPPSRRLHLALRKDAVSQQEARAASVLSLMFRLSLATLAAAFLLALLLLAWILRHEMAVQQRRRHAEHLAFAGILANGIIHDVRNPMSSLRLDIQMLQKEAAKQPHSDPERVRSLAKRARQTMDRLDAVMREFLFVSRPDDRVREPMNVNTCLRDCADLLHPRFERASVTLKLNLDESLPVITGHDVGLKRAATNILLNAIQASPPGGTVSLTSRQSDGRILIHVDDEGPGIPEKDIARIFDMFVSGNPDGTGLGLYLARVAVEKLSGSLTAANRPEGGARFTLSLPAQPERCS